MYLCTVMCALVLNHTLQVCDYLAKTKLSSNKLARRRQLKQIRGLVTEMYVLPKPARRSKINEQTATYL